MSKKILYLASILLTITVGTVLYFIFACDCGGKSTEMEAADAGSSIAPAEQEAQPVAPEPDPAEPVDWQAVRDRINDNPPTLQFEVYQTESTLSHDDGAAFEEIIAYLDNNPDGSLLVTGHTDISGSRSLNMKLSEGRAEFLKGLLVQHGIEADKISTTFKGPDEPIADNRTPEGRAKNRRAVVNIK
jgi:outer membrane protein OmpA-like peptidoglycan-associated protein